MLIVTFGVVISDAKLENYKDKNHEYPQKNHLL